MSGYMFGKGVYLADMSSKSANYCCAYLSNRTALLLLCEAELGNPMQKLINSSYTAGEDAKKQGMHSTWGQGRTGPNQWEGCHMCPSVTGGCYDGKFLSSSVNTKAADLTFRSPIHPLVHREILMLPEPIWLITSTSATMSPRFVSATYSGTNVRGAHALGADVMIYGRW